MLKKTYKNAVQNTICYLRWNLVCITGVLREIQLSSNQEQHIYTAGLFSSMLNEAICVFAILSMTVYFI